MHIVDFNGNKVDTTKVEYAEQNLASRFIHETDVVLELGARYGSVSCVINSKLNTKTNHVAVEPDTRVWNALETNKSVNGCEFHIVKGFVSNRKLDLINLDFHIDGYGATFVDNEQTNIPSYTLSEIKDKYGLNFNVLVADCEGFLERFFDENPGLYDELRMIMFEADYPEKCNYDKIRHNLSSRNFKMVGQYYHNTVWIRQ